MEQTVQKGDWEDFMAVGRVPRQIRLEVLESWKRSARHSFSHLRFAPTLTEDELAAQRTSARRLRRGAHTALQRAGRLLNKSGEILLLCDDAGVVLDAVGDSRTLARGSENHLNLGGQWTEEAIGTNAIGTSIKLGLPVMIREAEHFCEAIQRWNCVATPIAEPGTGRLLGVVDISWPEALHQTSAAALSAALALQVETELTRMVSRERETLAERIHLRRLRRGNDPLLIMDRSGADVFATEDFARFCEDDEALTWLRGQVPQIIDQTPDTIAETLSDCLHGADLEVIEDQGEAIGVMLCMRQRRAKALDMSAQLDQASKLGEASARLCAQARKLAQTTIPILIEGETGTGKTYLAEAIHHASTEAEGPFTLIDCPQLTEAGLREDLAEARYGLEVGVLCLNSPGAAIAPVQKLLLAAVEQASLRGMRIISLSQRSLYDEMRKGAFRSDLYYRIAGVRLHIPPLRERPEEIAPLLQQLVRCHSARQCGREIRFTSGAMDALKAYAWPGNIREMRNLVATLDALSPTGLIDDRTLPPEFRQRDTRNGAETTLRDLERAEIISAIAAENGNLSQVARRLGIARSTLYLKLDSFGIARSQKV
ncbi:sigma-54-dependent Fis family transcriptional regulator [Thioclava marina]|uniref:Sigma-54-dependent Fis family transcriptional regulator n=1 Tax=Thioclava marina TaxID=1915077 RepID=A0ABX3MSM8_9RHOB|nr:sigma 54-interacting transcriptional regulator [Thioclava marina]MBD3738870.1 sigma-54-dependent Fis family transcriptional regulator [Stutzerimonas balearica]OOY14183.1 sigma-54-dependent Fis family transcriptional regulator [Thioclava marina]